MRTGASRESWGPTISPAPGSLQNLTVALGGKGSVPTDLGIKVSKTLFAPRLGVVYRVNEKSVFRTG